MCFIYQKDIAYILHPEVIDFVLHLLVAMGLVTHIRGGSKGVKALLDIYKRSTNLYYTYKEATKFCTTVIVVRFTTLPVKRPQLYRLCLGVLYQSHTGFGPPF